MKIFDILIDTQMPTNLTQNCYYDAFKVFKIFRYL